MIWTIVIESVVIMVMGYMIWDLRRALRSAIDMLINEKNKQWLDALEKSGAKIVNITEGE